MQRCAEREKWAYTNHFAKVFRTNWLFIYLVLNNLVFLGWAGVHHRSWGTQESTTALQRLLQPSATLCQLSLLSLPSLSGTSSFSPHTVTTTPSVDKYLGLFICVPFEYVEISTCFLDCRLCDFASCALVSCSVMVKKIVNLVDVELKFCLELGIFFVLASVPQ